MPQSWLAQVEGELCFEQILDSAAFVGVTEDRALTVLLTFLSSTKNIRSTRVFARGNVIRARTEHHGITLR